jgi:hypothetical protein
VQPPRPGNPDHSDPSAIDRSSPLRLPRRATDRVEAVLRRVLLGVGAVVLVLAAVVGVQLHGSGVAQVQADAVNRVSVPATLLEPIEGMVGMEAAASSTQTSAPATWTAPDGTPRTGTVSLLGTQEAGAVVPVWVDRTGAIASPPVDMVQADVTAVVGGLLVVILGMFGLYGAWRLVRHRCAVSNHAAWAREWALYEPVWSGR